MTNSKNSPIACVLDAIPDEKRERHWWLVGQFQRAIEDVTELVDGFKFTLANKPDVIVHTAEWIMWERLCCPFLHFKIEVENENVSVSLTGRDDVKSFVESQLPVLVGKQDYEAR